MPSTAQPPIHITDPALLQDTALLLDRLRACLHARQFTGAHRLCAVLTAQDPQSVEAALNAGLLHRLRGDATRAEQGFARALRLQPDRADIWLNRAALRASVGSPDRALADATIAACLTPALGMADALRARLLYDQDEQAEAVAAANRALQLGENRPELPMLVVDGLRRLERLTEAETACRAFLHAAPTRADLWSLLGLILADDGKAAAAIGNAVCLEPTQKAALANRGNTLLRLRQPQAAARMFSAALTMDPGQAEAALGLSNARLDDGEWRAAAAVLAGAHRWSETANPSVLWRRVADLAEAAGDGAMTLHAVRQAVRHRPNDAGHWGRLARIAIARGLHSQGHTLFRRALALSPADSSLLTNSAIALVDEGRVDEAMIRLRHALRAHPTSHKAHSSLLFAQLYQSGGAPAERRDAHRAWGVRHAPSRPTLTLFPNSPDPERPLRIGLVSADLRRHPVGYFIAPFLAAYDRQRMAVIGYANHPAPSSDPPGDPLTRELMRNAAGWRWIGAMNDATAAATIQADGIDILIDLSGHTADHRLALFALRPAPIQATWLGYPHSAGVPAIDLIIGGGGEMPDTAADWFTERLLTLPNGRFCYRPPDEAPPVGPLPATRNGGLITFGSFNSLAKLSVETVALWARVLTALPNARLVLKARPLGDPLVCDRIAARFAAAGVDPQRLDLRGWSSHAAMLAEYGDIDVALDPLPFSGGLTSCESLWMGVPMVAWPNDRPAGRQSAHFLTLLGLPELVAHSADDSVKRTVELCRDPNRLALLRAGLRDRMRRSPLMDGPGFAQSMESALRQEWRRWCQAAPR